MFDLSGQVAIITGAAKGIGRATAVELARAGAKVVLAGVRESSMIEVKDEVSALTGEYMVVRTDVAKWEDAARMVDKTIERFGRIDILVNNAGIHPLKKDGTRFDLLEIGDADWDTVVNVNLKGQFNCMKAVAPVMMKQRSGKIVNLSSNTALTGIVGSAVYCASKAGIMGLTREVARELGPHNIIVNCVAPGFTLTPMNASLTDEAADAAVARTSLKRAGQATDIARVILSFLQDNLFTTGQTVVVDGGAFMH
jgi:3-oxoacyl-[acyl-carrier protein] reductase